MPNPAKSPEIVTDNPIMTGCDGLRRLDWLRLFRDVYPQKPDTNRHSTLTDETATTRNANVGRSIRRDFAAAFRSVLTNLPPHMMNETESAKREYSICVAALDCGIDPRDVSADLFCFISGTANTTEAP